MSSQPYKQGHFGPEFYKDLPIDLQIRVCRCISKGGWTQDQRTGWWVCEKCLLPSRYSAIRVCENCEKKFIPIYFPNNSATDWADSCPECLPLPGYNVEIEVEGSDMP